MTNVAKRSGRPCGTATIGAPQVYRTCSFGFLRALVVGKLLFFFSSLQECEYSIGDPFSLFLESSPQILVYV
jgi:hypothetical protein